jgi:YVTN family beta-propeller protein
MKNWLIFRGLRLLLALGLLAPSPAVLHADETENAEVSGEVKLDKGARLKYAYPMDLNEASGHLFIGGYESHNVILWDLEARAVAREARNIRHPHYMKFHPGQKKLFVLAYDDNSNAILVIYDSSLNELRRVTLGTYAYCLTLSADGSTAYVGLYTKILAVNTEDGTSRDLAAIPDYYFPFSIVHDQKGGRDQLAVLGMGWVYLDNQWVMRSALMTFRPSDGQRTGTLVLGDSLFSYDAAQDGDDLYIANIDANSIHVVDLSKMMIVAQIAGVSCPQRIVIHPTRRRLFVIDNYLDRFHVVDMASRRLVKTIYPGDDPSGIVFDSRGRCYTANYWSSDISVIDTETEEVAERIPLAASSPHSLYLDVLGRRLYISNGSSNGIFVMDPKTGKLIDGLTMPDGAFGGPLRVHGSRLFVVDKWRNGVGVYPTNNSQNAYVASHAEQKFIALPGVGLSGIAEAPGNLLCVPFVKGGRMTLALIDAAGERLRDQIDLGPGVQTGGVAVSFKKHRAYVADYAGGEVVVVDLKTKSVLGTISVERKPNAIAVHPVSDRVYVCNEGARSLAVIEDEPLEVLGYVDVGETPTAVAFAAAKGRVYVLNSGDQTLSVINELTHKVAETVAVGTSGETVLVDPSSDEIYVASPSSGQVVTVRDTYRPSQSLSSDAAAFRMREAYGFPNPARGVNPVLRIDVGLADVVNISIYDVSGRLVHEASLTDGPKILNTRYVYEYTWDVAPAAPGVYVARVEAKKAGQSPLHKVFKLAVIK